MIRSNKKMIDIKDIEIVVAGESHLKYIDEIIDTMAAAAKVRGTGIARRTHEYLEKVMRKNKQFWRSTTADLQGSATSKAGTTNCL